MLFSEKAQLYRILRRTNPHKFYLTKTGTVQVHEMARVVLRDKRLRDIGLIPIFYEEQNTEANTPEAQLVRMGLWSKEDVGWLWTYLDDGSKQILAKVTPKEAINLNNGWITEDGRYIVDLTQRSI